MGQDNFRVVYASIHGGIGKGARLSLRQEATQLNAEHSISGVLAVGEEEFFGVVEGTPIVVTNTLLRIARDHRHHGMKILFAETSKARICDDWRVLDLAELEESERCLAQPMVTAAAATQIDGEKAIGMISTLAKIAGNLEQ